MKNPHLGQCKNCDNKKFQKIEGVFAITKVEKNNNGNGITFLPASGIPLVVYMCTECGELKIFPTKLFDEI